MGRLSLVLVSASSILERGGFDIPVESKREQYLEAVDQICKILAMDPYSGFKGNYFGMPSRNIVSISLRNGLIPRSGLPAQTEKPLKWLQD